MVSIANSSSKYQKKSSTTSPLLMAFVGSALLLSVSIIFTLTHTYDDDGGVGGDGSSPSLSQTETQQLRQPKSHMLSLDPLPYSLHPKWKLWGEMSPSEQDEALDQVGVYLTKYGKLIYPDPPKRRKIKHGTCELKEFSNGHSLCGPPPEGSCTFFSFGINDDPSFDQKLAEDWNCRGFAGDPTVPHPSKLHPLVTFHNVGASMLVDNEERLVNKGGEEDWWITSMPKLRYWLGVEHVNIIKLDCEGCEFAFARDILREDPDFLKHVDQLSIETHVSKAWMTTREHLYYFGLHFALLEEAGFKMEWSDVFGCSKRHEDPGCLDEMYGFPCGFDPWPGHPNVVLGYSCQDFLWKRYH
jgi:hypothetical protein|mmetsp:Transcript_10198/g.22529  ORF Transcript_10198/g.22529 Transcript_10198/m.22529 type:complete len:356 (-) Transcript_10198:1181-2248(-)